MGKKRRKSKELILTLAEKYRGSTNAPCPHFGKCGGCTFQDISYENQLLLKKEYINYLCADSLPEIKTIHPANPYYYRNRMDYVTAFGNRGLRKRGSFKDVIDISQCMLLQTRSQEIWSKVRPFLPEIEDYNYLSNQGFLRYCILRQGFFSNETMLNFVISKNENIKQFEQIIGDLGSLVDSSTILLNDSLTDINFGPETHILKQGYIQESFDEIKFSIHPNSFFQSNSFMAKKMYSKIANQVKGRVLDLYCGVGSISLFCAKNAKHITGVDIIEESIVSAKENMKINKINNCEFVCADAKNFMKENPHSFDTLILDPPRAGINPKMYKNISDLNPDKIIYMSCNPLTFKTDFEYLQAYYELESFEAFDMFPQTPHIESLAILHKRNN